MENIKSTIEIVDGHTLKVVVNMNQPNGSILALGMLEMAKGAVQSWAVAQKMQREQSGIVKPTFTQKVMDKIRGH